MKKIILIVCLIMLYNSLHYKVEASFYRDKIFIGKNKEKYEYFFTATEYTKDSEMMEKIQRKVFPFRNKINLLIIAEIPPSLSSSEQKSMWNKLREVNLAMKELKYNKNIKFNGYLDKNISTYKIHVYYK